MNAQDIIDMLVKNKTRCLVCFHSDFKVETLVNNIIYSVIDKKVQKDSGLLVNVTECKNCGYLLFFNTNKTS